MPKQADIREGSHITKQVTIRWDERNLLHLLVSRLLENEPIRTFLGVEKQEVLAGTAAQERLFYDIFPDKVETGNNPRTFNWMVGRVKDGLGISAPREIIHLLNESRLSQIRHLERGTLETSYNEIISRTALKEALVEVSKVHIQQTLYTEYPELKPYIEILKERRESINDVTYWTPFLYREGLEMVQGRET